MKIECRNCGHGAHNGPCEFCKRMVLRVCQVFAPDWELLQRDLAFIAGAVAGIRSTINPEEKGPRES